MTTHQQRVENPTNQFINISAVTTSFTPPLPANIIREINALAHLARKMAPDSDIALLANDAPDTYTNPTLVTRNIPAAATRKFIALDASRVTGRELAINIGSADREKTWDAWLTLN